MPLNQSFIAEFQHESATTRKFMALFPADKADWKPHPKSMSLGALAGHIAELVTWMGATINLPELDFSKFEYKPYIAADAASLLAVYDKNTADALNDLQNATDAVMMENWSLRNGEQIYFTMPKIAVLRSFVFNHTVHHRAQLGVYYRMLDIPVPGTYGPTADEQM